MTTTTASRRRGAGQTVLRGDMREHLIGVAGAGMAPLAGLLREAGHDVSGSDIAFDPPMGPRLAAWGVRTHVGTDAALLDELGPGDAVVVGNVCRRDNPLAVAAEQRALRRISLPTALRELVFGTRPVVAVAGTHGKTTTTALLAALLASVGLDPGYLVGGIPTASIGATVEPRPFSLGRITRSLSSTAPLAPFVIEGDEYDSAFFEKTPKVWGYAPTMAILTSIEHDHVDIYPDAASYRSAFAGMLGRLPSDADGGLLVANAADPSVAALVRDAAPRARVVWYAASDVVGRPFPSGVADGEAPVWTAHEVGLSGRGDAVQPFDLFVGPTSAGRFSLGVFGVHIVANALAAIALAVEGFGLRVRDLAPALASFRGVQRRQEQLLPPRGTGRGVVLYDDFAHHPSAIDATLGAIRARHRDAKCIAVYEPRSATACRAMHQRGYVEAFAAADVVVLAPLGRSTIPDGDRLDLARLAEDLRARGKIVDVATSYDGVVSATDGHAAPGSVVVVMSNGAFGGVTARLREALA